MFPNVFKIIFVIIITIIIIIIIDIIISEVEAQAKYTRTWRLLNMREKREEKRNFRF